MSFAFHCPQGHLLQAEPEHAGQQSQCPFCQSMFVIPAPGGDSPTQPAEQAPPTPPAAAPPVSSQDFGPPVTAPPAPASPPTPYLGQPISNPEPNDPFAAMAAATSSESPQAPVEAPRETRILHIPCPNGHELETPDDMLDEDVVCPHCYTQFQAREKDSVEYKQKREREREIREMKTAKMWIWIAGIVAVVALVLIGTLMIISSTNN